MSHLDDNLPSPLDRLGLLLEHAHGMAMAMTCDDFDNINRRAKACLYDALHHSIMDAESAYIEVVDLVSGKGRADQ